MVADVAGRYTDLVTTVFSSTIAMKAWFATAAATLALVQVTTAARIYGRLHFLPERGPAIARGPTSIGSVMPSSVGWPAASRRRRLPSGSTR